MPFAPTGLRTSCRRHAGLLLDLAGSAVIVALAIINLRRFDLVWDATEYHMPFAAFRVGLLRHSAYELRDYLQSRYQGFPPLADWVQGLLWRLFGKPEATQLVSPIAIAAFAAYARWILGLRVLWSVAIFAAIPIMLTAFNSANVDVWTNAFFCIYLLAAFYLLRTAGEDWLLHTLIACLALAVAVNSKMQYFVIGAAALFINILATLVFIWLERRPGSRRRHAKSMAVLVAMAPVVFFSPVRNTLLFHNPVYPFTVQAFGTTLPGTQTNVWVGPNRLADLNRVERYALSELDFDAINRRPAGFNQDQGGQPEGTDGNRMGGALSVFLVGSAGALCVGLRRKGLVRADWVLITAAAILVAAVVAFPGSNELRYFCFVNIMVSVAAIAVIESEATSGDAYSAGLLLGLRLLLVGSAAFTNFATGLRQLGWTDAQTLNAVLDNRNAKAELANALRQSSVVCYIRPDSNAFLFSALLNPAGRGHSYRLIGAYDAAQCPPGAVVIR